MSIRTERVSGEIQKAIAHLLQTEFQSLSDGLLSVTKVHMAPDLKSCRVYISVLGGTMSYEKVLKGLSSDAPRIRYGIGKLVRLRYLPELRFYIDDTQDEVDKVEAIFKAIHAAEALNPRPIAEATEADAAENEA